MSTKVFTCWCGWQDDGSMTHEESLMVNDFQFGERAPQHLPSEDWNVPEPEPEGETDAVADR